MTPPVRRAPLAVVVCATFIAGATASIGTVLRTEGGVGPGSVVIVLTALRLVDMISHRVQPRDDRLTWQLGELLLIPALFLLRPLGVLTVFLLAIVASAGLSRTAIVKALFNAGAEALTVSLALAIYSVSDSSASPARLGTAVVAAAAYTAVGNAATAWVVHVATGQRFRDNFARGSWFLVVQWACSVSLGVLAAASTAEGYILGLVALVPVTAAQVVLVEHFRARRDRERLDGLFATALDAHASVVTEDVEDALSRSAARLLRCDLASIRPEPPQVGEIGAALSGGAEDRWLVVADRAISEEFGDEDAKLLEAIAVVGASALENARLVDEIRQQAIVDPTTGLANQVLFEDRTRQAIAAATRARGRLAVLVLDLDGFKRVNDSLGHSAGNALLRAVGSRLLEVVGDGDTVARLGSDHFTVLLPGVGTVDAAGAMASRLLGAVRRPIELEGQELFMTASIGVALFPDDGAEAEHLLRNADSAMHRAKSIGSDGYQAYAAGMNERAHMRLARESELHNAVIRGELLVRYQPQIELRSGRIMGVEALVRWNHPVLGLTAPYEFVPLAEESGLILAIDEWVLGEACAQACRWADEGVPPVRVAVNLSGRHFHGSDRLLRVVKDVLNRTGLAPSLLELEVTEGIAVGEAQDAIDLLAAIRNLGVRVAIDDFGTGYSMLSRLQRFPVDRLKIDRTFVREIKSAHTEAPIVVAMIAMARSLKLDIVAEGVETLEQQTFLRNHGCTEAQGFLFSQAVDPDEVVRLLRTPSVGLNVAAMF